MCSPILTNQSFELQMFIRIHSNYAAVLLYHTDSCIQSVSFLMILEYFCYRKRTLQDPGEHTDYTAYILYVLLA